MNNIEKLKQLLKENHGMVLTSDLKKHNIARQYLRILMGKGIIERAARGVYVSTDTLEDEFYCLQKRYARGVFSHNTALYFYDLTDRTPISIDLTFPCNYRMNRNTSVSPYYVKEDLFALGITEMKSPMGHKVRVYDMERTICDVIKSRNKMDFQIVIDAVKRYAKRRGKNLPLLSMYAKKLRVDKILRPYMEVLV